MFLVASDDGRVVGEEGVDDAVGEGDLLVVEENDADVFDGDGGGGFVALTCGCVVARRVDEFHHQLAVAEAEHGGIAETECAFDHGDKN